MNNTKDTARKIDLEELKELFVVGGDDNGGNVSRSRHLFTERSCAKVTYYICTNCGYVEEYLDQEELHKLM